MNCSALTSNFCVTVFHLSLKVFVTSVAEQLIPSYLSIKNNILLPRYISETHAFQWNCCVLNRMCLGAHKEKDQCVNLSLTTADYSIGWYCLASSDQNIHYFFHKSAGNS